MQSLLRLRGLAFILLGRLTAGMVLGQWFPPPHALALPLIVAYFLFNFGVGVTAAKGFLTRATRLGCGAVVLNFVAMLVSQLDVVWTVLSAAAALLAFIAAYMLFKEATAVTV